jgi:hypothetical protein
MKDTSRDEVRAAPTQLRHDRTEGEGALELLIRISRPLSTGSAEGTKHSTLALVSDAMHRLPRHQSWRNGSEKSSELIVQFDTVFGSQKVPDGVLPN